MPRVAWQSEAIPVFGLEVACRASTVPAIARFYQKLLGCTVSTPTAGQAVVCVGPGVHLVYVENDQLSEQDIQKMEEVHISKQLPRTFRRALSHVPPVIVCGPGMRNLPTLVETGYCVSDLSRLQQDVFAPETLGNDLLVLEVDFFRADMIANLANDNAVVALVLQAIDAAILGWSGDSPTILNAGMVQDFGIVRARQAVSHFGIGSAAQSPSSVRLADRLYICGDWIDRTGHASWSTEKAVVTGRQAAAALLQDLNVEHSPVEAIPAASDTVPLQALRNMVSLWRRTKPDRPGLFPRLP